MKKLGTKQFVDHWVGGACVLLLRFITPVVGLVLRRRHELTVGKDLVFTKFLGGGSLFIGLPALIGLRRRHPQTRFTFVTTPSLKPFAELTGVFDRIVLIDDASAVKLALSAARAWRQLLFVDTIVDLEVYSRASTVFSVLTMARNRIGFYLQNIFWRKFISTHLIFFNRSSGLFMFYEQVAYFLGAEPATMPECRAALLAILPPSPASNSDSRRLAIGPFCSEFGRERMLTPTQWVAVLRDRVRLDDTMVHILGGKGDHATGNDLLQTLRRTFPGLEVRNECGRWDLKETVAFLADVDEYWGVDSALLHFARLLGISCGSVWGPTDPSTRLKPIQGLKETILYNKIFCSPCIHVAEKPPCRGDNRCIKSLIDPSVVVDGREPFTTWFPLNDRHKA